MRLLVLILPPRIVYYLSCHLLFLSLLLCSTSTSIVEVAAATSNNNNLAFVGHVSSSSITSSRTMMNKNSNSINDNKAAAAVEKEEEEDNSMNIVHRFGQFIIPKTNIFCLSPNKIGSIAFVNLRPIVPGHVLVTTKRIVPFVEDLTEEEYIDMWLLVRRVQTILKVAYPKTTAFNIAVQDGTDAGQSIPHVHVHILPRRSSSSTDPFGGEKNDEIYDQLEKWAPTTTVLVDEKQEQKQIQNNLNVPNDNERIDRTEEMMTNEANMYRQLSLSLQK
jgi:bis(5'-adenosyl)-triphosphatase